MYSLFAWNCGNQNSFLDSSLETRLGEQQPHPQGFSFENGTSPGDEVVVLKTGCTLKCTPLKTAEETGSRWLTQRLLGSLLGTRRSANRLIYQQNGNVSWRRRAQIKQLAWPIGHFGVEWGTGASFKFELIDKLTPPYKMSCWDWLFDQVWCSKVEQGSSYDSWNMVKRL